jgi:pimeloyl-ACP methyl ester carboxylesterase
MESTMAMDTHTTAPNRYVEANSIRYAYRRFGAEKGVPLLFLQHFRGGMDNWDPRVTDGLAEDCPGILVNGARVGGSGGTTPNTIEAMADDTHQFLVALEVRRLDVLGFSLGGLSQHIPNAQLIIYPKSGHGALFQYSTLFVQHTRMFLNA